MQVLPSPIGVKYSQTVEVKAQNLPKGSGSIAVTICGLNNAAGQKIATPTADDCAGANDLSSGLVKLAAVEGRHVRPAVHAAEERSEVRQEPALLRREALLRARRRRRESRAIPAYHLDTEIAVHRSEAHRRRRRRPSPTTTKTPTTTKAKKPTTTTPPARGASTAGRRPTPPPTEAPRRRDRADAVADRRWRWHRRRRWQRFGGSASVAVTAPTRGTHCHFRACRAGRPSNPIPPQVADAVTQACAQLAQVVQQGGGDATRAHRSRARRWSTVAAVRSSARCCSRRASGASRSSSADAEQRATCRRVLAAGDRARSRTAVSSATALTPVLGSLAVTSARSSRAETERDRETLAKESSRHSR